MPEGKKETHWYCRWCKFNLSTPLRAVEVTCSRGHKMKRVDEPVLAAKEEDQEPCPVG